MAETQHSIRDYAADLVYRAVLRGALALPYRWRVPLTGWFLRRLVGPAAGYGRRVRANLALVWPELAPETVARIVRGSSDNLGRAVIEVYSGQEFIDRVARIVPEGPGLSALQTARQAGRPVIVVTAHFGNFDAVRAWLFAHGHRLGGLYVPQANPYFNTHYEAAISRIGTPVFPRTRKGLAAMVRHLKTEGLIGLVADQHVPKGARLTFFGKPAMTTLSPAEMALKYGAILLPVYGIRTPDGLGFRLRFEAPIPASDPETMSQALNDNLEHWVRQYPEQWLWSHRRWKAATDPPPAAS